MTPNNGI